jgi:hypothetical protein
VVVKMIIASRINRVHQDSRKTFISKFIKDREKN